MILSYDLMIQFNHSHDDRAYFIVPVNDKAKHFSLWSKRFFKQISLFVPRIHPFMNRHKYPQTNPNIALYGYTHNTYLHALHVQAEIWTIRYQ